nr:hypothetical protein [Pseudomonas migulae]
MIHINQAVFLRPVSKKSCDKFLTACYVLLVATKRRACVIFLSCGHFMLKALVIYSSVFSMSREGFTMDDYQEELLEFQAFELDPLEPAEDATEL